jgi:hypothetical protein
MLQRKQLLGLGAGRAIETPTLCRWRAAYTRELLSSQRHVQHNILQYQQRRSKTHAAGPAPVSAAADASPKYKVRHSRATYGFAVNDIMPTWSIPRGLQLHRTSGEDLKYQLTHRCISTGAPCCHQPYDRRAAGSEAPCVLGVSAGSAVHPVHQLAR